MSDWQVSGFDEVRELGAGAQGRVVLARHEGSGSPVAIKYVASVAAGQVEGLRREARLLGQVSDPHVARLYRLVESEHGAAIVMEAVEGVPLKRVLAEHGRLTPEQALTVLKGSLLGLAAAHGVGVVHRDYKPANVVVRADGLSKLIDFGIAIPAGEGNRSGTPAYMAPEQWRGEPATPAADVYAATCVFYECLAGRRPFGGDAAALMAGHLNAPPPVEDVPEAVRGLLARGMAKDPASRPAGAAAFVGELEAAATAAYGADWETRGIRALAGAAVALASLFPLAAAGLAPTTAAATTAAAGTSAAAAGTGATAAGGTGGGAASGGFLAGVGGKVAVGVAGTALVAGGGTAAYSVQHDSGPAKARPVAAVIATESRLLSGVPVAVRSQYAKITGLRDGAVQQSANQQLRAPVDWTVQRLSSQTAEVETRSMCKGNNSTVALTARMGVKGPSLVSAVYANKSTLCFPVDGVMPGWAVTVDLKTGRALTADDVFKPGTLTASGIRTLWGRLTVRGGSIYGPTGCRRGEFPERADFFPSKPPPAPPTPGRTRRT
ncbi:serine/threonine-protein kinase [Actinomadura yumaensis]|uniref:serine/threonine-protein kinase n=1 Tax=Actinomadura yumaensis TaxID=111807 RepID=UPI00360E90D9